MSARKKDKFGILKAIGSVRLAFALFLIIICVSFVGAVVPEQYRESVYYSWWFILLLFVFAANLLACVAGRLILRRKNLGSAVTHASVLVILAGALISFLGSQRGYVRFIPGETADHFVSQRSTVQLPFSIGMDKFETEWYPLSVFKIRCLVQDSGLRRSLDAVIGEEYVLSPAAYRIKVIDYFPDFYLDEDNTALNGSSDPRNPALRLAISSEKGSEERWVFANHPSMGRIGDANIKVAFDAEPMVKEYRSFITVTDGQYSKAVVVRVNHPFSRKGFTVYQSGSPEQPALEVVSDPGTALVFLGFILLNAGIIMLYAVRLRPSKQAG